MSLEEEARRYADTILGMVPELIHQSVKERREQACWHELKAQHRRKTCRPIMRPWWDWRVRVHEARCAANKTIAGACRSALALLEAVESDGRA